MKITVDKNKCIGCGACRMLASQTFGVDEDGKTIFLAADKDKEEDIRLAANSCPTAAIEITED